MTPGGGSLAWESVLLVGVTIAQAVALVALCWIGVRLDRYLRDGQRQATDTARAAAATLDAIQRTQLALVGAAGTATDAARALADAAREDDSVVLSELSSMVRQLLARGPASPVVGPADESRPAAADLQELRRLGHLQGEAAELRRRLEDRDRQLEELNRDRRRFAHEAAQLAGVKATNERLMAELKEKRHELRQLQASLDPMSLEVKSLRSQIAVLQRQIGMGTVDPSRMEGALAEERRGVYEERLQELDRRNHTLEDQLRATRDELVRTQREKAFIEEHYLDLAQA